MKLAVALALLLATSHPARADETFAQTAFKQAEQLAKQGKWADACPLYEASYKADPQLGVLLHLADCHEHVGRVATAFSEFSDAVELAHSRGDPRETLARTRADALASKVTKLHLAPPKLLIPGLVVHRDGTDITLLVGTDMPTDPGDHEIIASAAGYVDWKATVTVAAGVVSVEIPPLEKVPPQVVAPIAPVAPIVHEGTLHVTTQPNATIMIDAQQVGTGSYEAKLKSGGHTLRVVAEGMRPYQQEVVVGDNETRTIDVPLEKEAAEIVYVPAPPQHEGPRWEVGLGFAPGEKGYADHPAEIAYRFDFGHHIGEHVDLGLFVEYASISTSGTCGTTIAGPTPSTPYDFGARNQFNGCRYFMPGFHVDVHILPKRRIDPFVGVAPGFRLGFADITPYTDGMAGTESTTFFPGVLVDLRVGVNYHPSRDVPGWAVGVFFDTQVTLIGQEDDNNNGKGVSYVSLFGGLRSSLVF